MFTGIITAIGIVERAAHDGDGLELTIAAPYRRLALGESIAVDGACLTVKARAAGRFTVHAVTTTLERTALGSYAHGRRVNLERAVRAGDRLGGHLVQGHVDAIGAVVAVHEHGDARLVDIRVPPALADVTVPLGSITVDGVSLTVNAIPAPGIVQVSLIPFTLQHTTLGERRPGDAVQLEGDTIGKYVQQFVRKGE
ncbi:MAG: riboflavin synthase [Gemmatimonadales bacterium]|nr:riboflavin synthase [Gemmatimonadales bacterium]